MSYSSIYSQSEKRVCRRINTLQTEIWYFKKRIINNNKEIERLIKEELKGKYPRIFNKKTHKIKKVDVNEI